MDVTLLGLYASSPDRLPVVYMALNAINGVVNTNERPRVKDNLNFELL